jgi:hypothetical protein
MVLSADDLLRSLPLAVNRLACTCESPVVEYFSNRKQQLPGLSLPLGAYCTLCGKTHKYTLSSPLSHKQCEGCDRTYSPDWRNDTEVIDFCSYNLCKDC